MRQVVKVDDPICSNISNLSITSLNGICDLYTMLAVGGGQQEESQT